MAERDYILDDDGDLEVVNGDFVFGDSQTDDVDILLRLNQGELKYDALCGTNMARRIRGNESPDAIIRALRLQLERDGKNFQDIKDYLKTRISG